MRRVMFVIADADRDAVFTLSPAGAAVATLARPGGHAGPGATARDRRPASIGRGYWQSNAVGIIWVADAGNQALRKITPAGW